MSKTNIFSNWHLYASVRNAPQRQIETEAPGKFFSANLAPVLSHPSLLALPETALRQIEIQFLYRYLEFTEHLETAWVNRVILSIMNNKYPISMSTALRNSAYKIYCDEAYHALQSHDMLAQIEEWTGVPPLGLPPVLDNRLAKIQAQFPEHLLPYFDLFFVCVAETLVSCELREHIKDNHIHPAVQGVMRDHACDEAAHALFFGEIMDLLKKEFNSTDYQLFKDAVPQFLEAYLLPDATYLSTAFTPFLPTETINNILKDSLKPEKMQAFIDQSSVKLRKYLQ